MRVGIGLIGVVKTSEYYYIIIPVTMVTKSCTKILILPKIFPSRFYISGTQHQGACSRGGVQGGFTPPGTAAVSKHETRYRD